MHAPSSPLSPTHRLTRVALILGGILGVVCVLLLPGCGGQEAGAEPSTRVASFTVSINNRTGHRVDEVYVHRIDPPLSFGRIAAGAIERKQAAKQTMPRKIEIEWVNPENGKTEWAIAHIHKKLGVDYHGSVTITIYGHNEWKLKKGA